MKRGWARKTIIFIGACLVFVAVLIGSYFVYIRHVQRGIAKNYAHRINSLSRKRYVRSGGDVTNGVAAKAYWAAQASCKAFRRSPTAEAFAKLAASLSSQIPMTDGTSTWPVACKKLGFAPNSERSRPSRLVTDSICEAFDECGDELDLAERATFMESATSPIPAWPLVEIQGDVPFGPPLFNPFINLGRAIAIRGHLQGIAQGNPIVEIEATTKSIRMAQDMGRGGGWVSFVVGQFMAQTGINQFARLVTDPAVSKDVLRELERETDNLIQSEPDAFEAILAEYGSEMPFVLRFAEIPMAANHPMTDASIGLGDLLLAHHAMATSTFYERVLALEGKPFPIRLGEYHELERYLNDYPLGLWLDQIGVYVRPDIQAMVLDCRLRLVRAVAKIRLAGNQPRQEFQAMGADVKYDPLVDAAFGFEVNGDEFRLFSTLQPENLMRYLPKTGATTELSDELTITFHSSQK
jgi:hypothetical protein